MGGVMPVEKGSYADLNYTKPEGVDEGRVETISTSWHSKADDQLKKLVDELDELKARGDMRVGYKTRAGNLRNEINRSLKS